jgi:hypothetical protein
VLSYGITVHLHSIEFPSRSKSATLCLNYSSCSTRRTGTGVSQRYRRANRLGYGVAVLILRRPSQRPSKPELSQQQRPQYWTYRGSLGNSSKRPEALLTGLSTAFGAFKRSEHSSPPSQYLSQQKTVLQTLLKGPITVSKHGS